MKDIYSPLDIDEEWDNMAPMADAPMMASSEGATAVAVKPDASVANEDTASTLPTSMEAPVVDNTDAKESTAEDAAFTVANADMGAAMNNDDKLNIGEINPAINAETPQADRDIQANENMTQDMKPAMPEKMPEAMAPENEENKAATAVPVIDMNEAKKEMTSDTNSTVSVGESFAPEQKPDKNRFEDMDTKKEKPAKEVTNAMPEANEKAEPQESAATELPVTPSDNKNVSKFSKNEMKFDMGEAPSVTKSHLEFVMGEWQDMKDKTRKDLLKLRQETEEKLSSLEAELSSAEAQKAQIDTMLSELGETA